MARWHARRDARWARERDEVEHAGQLLVEDAPSPSRPSGSTQAGAGGEEIPSRSGGEEIPSWSAARATAIPRPHAVGERWQARSPRRRGGKLGGAGLDAGSACAVSGKGPPYAIEHHRPARKTPPLPPRLADAAGPSAGMAQKAEPRCLRGVERAARPRRLGTRAPRLVMTDIAARRSNSRHPRRNCSRTAQPRDRAGPYPSGRTALGVTRVPRDYQPNYHC